MFCLVLFANLSSWPRIFLQLASSLSYFQTFGLQSVQFFSSFDVVDVKQSVFYILLQNICYQRN